MKNLICYLSMVISIIIILSGCKLNNEKPLVSDSNQKLAHNYLIDKGYTIISQEEWASAYVLTKEHLVTQPYMQIWGVLSIESGDYINKPIQSYHFKVKNHPIEHLSTQKEKYVNVWVMMYQNEIIGGHSFPDDSLYGGAYSLEGKTLEEVTGESYQVWRTNWLEKYK